MKIYYSFLGMFNSFLEVTAVKHGLQNKNKQSSKIQKYHF